MFIRGLRILQFLLQFEVHKVTKVWMDWAADSLGLVKADKFLQITINICLGTEMNSKQKLKQGRMGK